jgi:hypothetical protein
MRREKPDSEVSVRTLAKRMWDRQQALHAAAKVSGVPWEAEAMARQIGRNPHWKAGHVRDLINALRRATRAARSSLKMKPPVLPDKLNGREAHHTAQPSQ